MSKKASGDILIREKRQVTIPRDICDQLGIEPGDRLNLYVEGNKLIAQPKKSVALDALNELQQLFKKSDVKEKELLEEIPRIRRKLIKKHYGVDA